MSAVEMARLIRAKKLSAREALAAHLTQIERVNPKVNAIVTLVPEMAAAAAAKADEMQARGETLGPLHGLPVAHKDLLETRGIRTTFGSPLYKDNVPTEDDIVVERMRRAGAITIGKTNTPEFGSGSQTFNTVFGATRNPYDLTKTCGGSSGGAAVALACGLVPVARRVRYRRLAAQSRGVLQRGGLPAFPRPRAQPESRVRVVDAEHVGMPGAFGGGPCLRAEHDRRARFPRAALNQRTGRTLRPPARPQLQRCACGVVQGPGRRALRSARARRGGRDIARHSSRWGASSSRRSRTSLPPRSPFACCARGTRRIRMASASARTRTHSRTRSQGEIEEGLRLTGADVARAETAHGQLWRRFQAFLEKYEYFVLPTTQLPPFDVNTPYPTEIAGVKFDNYIDWMKSCWYISATGNPAASVPAGFTPEGLPVGVQIVGRTKSDFSVLQLAHAFEQATGFGKRHPAIA